MGDVLLCELQKLVDENQRRTSPLKVLQGERCTNTSEQCNTLICSLNKVVTSDPNPKSCV